MPKGGKRTNAGRRSSGRTKELHLYVTPETDAKLSAIAKQQKIPKGQILENLLEQSETKMILPDWIDSLVEKSFGVLAFDLKVLPENLIDQKGDFYEKSQVEKSLGVLAFDLKVLPENLIDQKGDFYEKSQKEVMVFVFRITPYFQCCRLNLWSQSRKSLLRNFNHCKELKSADDLVEEIKAIQAECEKVWNDKVSSPSPPYPEVRY